MPADKSGVQDRTKGTGENTASNLSVVWAGGAASTIEEEMVSQKHGGGVCLCCCGSFPRQTARNE